MTDLRALLLTDVIDSTRLSERLGDRAMAEVWAAHDRVARDLLPRWRGREIDKTDGMLLLFDTAAEALQYAQAYHRALAGLPVPLQARAGLHVGPVILRENTPEDVARGAKPLEVDGLAKPIAARVMSLARGGQTLLTPEAREAIDDWLDLGALQVRSHGHWVLKGVAAPVELFEVGDDPSRFAAPPDGEKVYRVVRLGERWLPVREIANNLPVQLTSFIGREQELGELRALLGKTRLLTLLGMGGLGKTRLSLQLAAELMAEYPDGVWFLDLAPLRDAALVVGEAAQAMGVREEPGRPLLQTLCAHLKTRRVLVILDNCEHLLKPTALMAHAILKAAPQVAFIASSREALRVPGERAYPILPLPLPGRHDSLATLARSTAVRLFVERAQEQRLDFTLTEAEAPAVAELVARLEGIPLALELAAARVRSMTVADINRRLNQRYQLLTDGSIVLEERQQTLRALVDWSYDLLNAAEQRVLQRLAVFAGGFDLAAAEAVCGADPVAREQVLELLASLVEKSLLGMEHRAGQARYRMLETLRDYAGEKLAAAGDQAATAARHCQHFFEFSKDGSRGLPGPEQALWLRRYEDEVDNLRAAKALAVAGGVDPVIAVKLAVNMMGFWMLRGYATEGRAVVREVLALPEVLASDVAHAWALYTGAALAGSQGEHGEALRLLQACLALRRGLGNPVQIAATLSTLALERLHTGDPAGAARDEAEALQLFRQEEDQVGEAIGLLHLGQIAMHEDDDQRAAEHLVQARAVARDIGHHEVQGESERVLGELAWSAGDLDRAAAHFDASLAVCRDAADRHGEAQALRWLGKTDGARGDLASARQRLGEALRAFDTFEMHEEIVGSLEDFAELALAEGRAEAAVELAAAVAQAASRLALLRPPRAERYWQAVVDRLRISLDPEPFDASWQRGARWQTGEAVGAALQAPPA